MASQSENTADNQSTVFVPSKKTKTLVDSIKKRLGKWATKNNNLKLEDTRYIREEISNCVADLFSEYVIDFYAKPEDLRKQITKLCENNTTNEQITEKIVSCLVDDDGRNGRDPEFIFQEPGDVQKTLQKLSDHQDIESVCRAMAATKINWNTTFPNIINSAGDNYDKRRRQIGKNLQLFFVTHSQDISVLNPRIEKKKDSYYLLPNVFILMEADTSENCQLRRYTYNNPDEINWYNRFSAVNLSFSNGENCFLTDTHVEFNHTQRTIESLMYRFLHRTADTLKDFVLKKQEKVIYLMRIRIPVNECRGGDQTDCHDVYYVGQAKNDLLDRWCIAPSSHMNEVWSALKEMKSPAIKLNQGLCDCALAYAHVMGYPVQLFIIDTVKKDDSDKVKKRLAKTEEIINEAQADKEEVKKVWEKHYGKCLDSIQTPNPVEPVQQQVSKKTRSGSKSAGNDSTEFELPPLEFVQWYHGRHITPAEKQKIQEFKQLHKYKKPKLKLLDVFEQWWIDQMQSTADKNGLNQTKRKLTANFTTHFYHLVKWSAINDKLP